MTKSDPKVSIDIGASAKISASVETKIPEKSSGRVVDALTDIIRPFSESRGLKADQIRLQREDVLIKIASKARDRALLENFDLKPVPNKFLIPFLEKASLEDIDSELETRKNLSQYLLSYDSLKSWGIWHESKQFIRFVRAS
ncbi:hypothetical protein FDK21_06915 [Cohaesibacter sp. CAU 1516]|uniref:hypothetical protein n=1 Tax=Cohaesibacter sp. CAU 1516 TaxID=2576038 RepID=UPI0010FD4CE6|nr:hypothetical protein [Cohaesibacter sp. CAU 1516]TLP49325.1 hypothetical protein FDK21_06915 [Cohaesibacter sp. CAU 1516]